MTCVYTGARVFFEEYGFIAPADLFLVDKVVVIRWNKEGRHYSTAPHAEMTHSVVVGNTGWHQEDIGVTVVPQSYITGEAFR